MVWGEVKEEGDEGGELGGGVKAVKHVSSGLPPQV